MHIYINYLFTFSFFLFFSFFSVLLINIFMCIGNSAGLPTIGVELSNMNTSNNNIINNINSTAALSPTNNIHQHGSSISILDDAFWEISNLKNYTTLAFTISVVLANVVFINSVFVESPVVTDLIGYSAMLLESTLAVPQLYRNHVNKSCAGLSLELIAAWVLGDLFKTLFFLSKGSPAPFILCGLIQLSVDFGIVCQLYMYSSYNRTSHFTASKR